MNKTSQALLGLVLLWVQPVSAELRVADQNISSSIAFEWDAVSGADRYVLWLGSASGTRDLGVRSSAGESTAINQLPTDGQFLHATLRARVDGHWRVEDQIQFSARSEPLINFPITGSSQQELAQLRGKAAKFAWSSAGDGHVMKYLLMAGTLDDPDAYSRRRAFTGDEFVSLQGLPIDGSSIWVTLMWRGEHGRWRKERPVEFQASLEPRLQSPVPGGRFDGSAQEFAYSPYGIQGATDRRLRIGTTDSSTAYGVWKGHNPAVASLPVDGSPIIVHFDFHDGRRWVNVSRTEYQSALPGPYLWGECTEVDEGRRLGWTKYGPWDMNWQKSTRGTITSASLDWRLYRIVSDRCASDSAYITLSDFIYHPGSNEKGVLLWLAPDSGAAEIGYSYARHAGDGAMNPDILRALHASKGIATPVFLPLPNYEVDLRIRSLDPTRPVKISEIRSVPRNFPVTSYRMIRYNDELLYFAAMSGDPRARVTAAIAEDFGPWLAQAAPNGFSCGIFKWIDATWIIDQGLVTDIHYRNQNGEAIAGTVWVNWELVSNDEIISAIEASMQAGIARDSHVLSCTEPAPTDSYNIDWLGLAEAARNGNSDGPVLRYE